MRFYFLHKFGMPIKQAQQFLRGGMRLDLAPLVQRKRIWSAAKDGRRLFLGQSQLFADTTHLFPLMFASLQNQGIACGAETDTALVVEPAIVADRTKPAGKSGYSCRLTIMGNNLGPIFIADHTAVTATHTLKGSCHDSFLLELDHRSAAVGPGDLYISDCADRSHGVIDILPQCMVGKGSHGFVKVASA